MYGLTYPDSSPATAKYGSKLALATSSDGARTTWTATAQCYGGYDWQPCSGAAITIGPATVRADDKSVATWVESTSELHSFQAVAAETDDVWGGTSAAVQPAAPPAAARPSAPIAAPRPARSVSSAIAAARGVDRRLVTVRKVIELTRSNDVNHLLGKKRGYRSAAVLVDRRLRCKGDPGVDCGATIERFTSATKAKQRKQYIQRVLRSLPALGTEHDEVQGRFLLRVSGELSAKQAKAYKNAFRSAL